MIGRIKNWIGGNDPETKARLATALVLFACSDEDAAAIDVALGPCVERIGPRGGRVRPIAMPSSQHYSTTLDQLEVLGELLTGLPGADALNNRQTAGQGTMARLSEPFATALAALEDSWAGLGEDQPSPMQGIAERWFAATGWPRKMQLGGVEWRVGAAAYAAWRGRTNDHHVYAWQGPSIEEHRVRRGRA